MQILIDGIKGLGVMVAIVGGCFAFAALVCGFLSLVVLAPFVLIPLIILALAIGIGREMR